MALTPPLTFTNAQTELSTLTTQTGNFTFDSDELTQALTEAWNDNYVVNQVWDSSISFQTGTWQYALPSTVTVVRDLYYQRSTDDYPERLSPELYEIVNGNIQFLEYTQNWLDDTYTIYIKGAYKLTTSDSLSTYAQVNYVINLAAELLLNRLLLKKTFVFLTNDTTVAEIVAALKIYSAQVLTYKQAILREFESA